MNLTKPKIMISAKRGRLLMEKIWEWERGMSHILLLPLMTVGEGVVQFANCKRAEHINET